MAQNSILSPGNVDETIPLYPAKAASTLVDKCTTLLNFEEKKIFRQRQIYVIDLSRALFLELLSTSLITVLSVLT